MSSLVLLGIMVYMYAA